MRCTAHAGQRGGPKCPDPGHLAEERQLNTLRTHEYATGPLTKGMMMGRIVGWTGVCAVLLAAPAASQEVPSGTVLVANMDDDSVWLVDARSGERRAAVASPDGISFSPVTVSRRRS